MTRRHDDPADFGMVLTMIRLLRGWSQADIARVAGLSAGTVSRYETRTRLPAREAVDRIAASAGLSAPLVDRLLDWIGTARAEIRGLEVEPPVPPKPKVRETAPVKRETEMEMDLHRALDGLFGSLSGPSLWPGDRYRMRRPESPTETPEEDRLGARELWSRLERLEADDRILLVDEGAEYQSWALCELVCEKCLEAAEDRPREALELAELAVFISERVGGPEAWKQRLQGYASAHLGHVRMAAGNLRGAARAFLRARRLWEGGASADPGILDAARFRTLDPEASQETAT